ncbi:MAG: biosynthetic-type acetolactate synthase large subunit [bacterium]
MSKNIQTEKKKGIKNPKNGAEALIKCLEDHGVEIMFGHPGGAAIPIFDALVDSSIKFVLTRHEQGATHMADGYAKATGKVGVVLVTSGPGATNTVTGLLTALMDSAPILVLTGQTVTSNLGKDAFQEADVYGITVPVVKHSYLVKDANEIPRIVKESMHIANSGRKGPVLIDLPKDVTGNQDFTAKLDQKMDIPGYKTPTDINVNEIKKMATLLSNSQKPLLLAGQGVTLANAEKELFTLAETLQAPVTTTLLGKSCFPENHALALGMLGMHGTAYANKAVGNCDLIFSIGCRWDDRITPLKIEKFCPNAKKLHIDIDPSEINKIVTPDAHTIGDAKKVLTELIKHCKKLPTKPWLDEINKNKKKFPLTYKIQGGLKAQQVIDECYKLSNGQAIVSTDVGQHQMWAAQFYKNHKEKSWISSGGAGTMGYGLPSAIGAQFGQPDRPVITIVGDGGFQMTCCELATAAIHKLPIKILIIDNKYLGMVRQWQGLFYDNRLSGVDLEGNPDFLTLGKAYGIKGFRIKRPAEIKKILKAALAYNDGPCIIHAEVVKEDNVFPMIPAGGSVEDMILDAKGKREKPKGST